MTERPSLFRFILAATATPHTAEGTVITAARLALRQDARLKLVHATPLLKGIGHAGGLLSKPKLVIKRMESDPRMMAQNLLALYAGHYPELKTDDILIAPGVAWEVVFRAAAEQGCDLIVVGPHTQQADAKCMSTMRRFLGGTADGVIRQACCPVLIVNRAFESDLLKFTNIVVGVDFSVSCAAAICLAAMMAKRNSAFVSTFHMLPVPPYPKYTPQALQVDRQRMQKRLNALCSRLLERISHQFFLKPGARPHEELLRFAQQFGADLIIMGSHTKEKAGKWYSGSVVQQVACISQCPVMVVNGLEALSPWKFDDPLIRRFVDSFDA
jgi:nucleotide-binding universal stress UspA family protein